MVSLQTSLTFIILSLFMLAYVEVKSGKRRKRIFFGHTATDNNRDAYLSFRYYVFLAKGNYFGAIDEDPPWWKKKWFKNTLVPRKHELVCGGILLTPSIVQTACHCLSSWTPKEESNYTYVWPLNVWEDRIYTYVGSNDINAMYYMLIPEHYIVYQQCRRIAFIFNYNIMDFGLILSKESINKKAPKAAISYAPVYRGVNVKEFYYAAVAEEYMCLLIGHGLWDIIISRQGYPAVSQDPSELVRWGWRTIMNPVDCISALYTPLERKEYRFPNYTRDATWVCLQAFQHLHDYLYNLGGGDSGGPVTCNNVYFAINSFAINLGAEFIISNAGPIAYTSFENAAEYRDQFIKYCNDYNNAPAFPVPHPTDSDLDPTPPPIDIFPASHCPAKMIFNNLMIILSTILLIFCWPCSIHHPTTIYP